MQVNKSEKDFFEILAKREEKNPSKPLEELTVEEFREAAALFMEFVGKKENVITQKQFITARDGYKIPIQIFNANIETPGPLLIMYPGGGYVMNTFDAMAVVCSRIAKFSGLKVILVNYRLAPENPMPIPIFDAIDATKYIATHPNEFQHDAEQLFIGGFSAGAHAAAVISNLAQTDPTLKIKHQILLNGAYNALLKEREYAEWESQDLMVSRDGLKYIYNTWGLTDKALESPIYSPYFEPNTSKLPKTTMIIGEFDGMRSESEIYFQKLKEKGCDISKILLPGQCHHTILLRGAITDGEDPAEVIAKVFREK